MSQVWSATSKAVATKEENGAEAVEIIASIPMPTVFIARRLLVDM